MKCKYCQAELESNSSVCPSCGKDNLKDDLKVLKIVALSLVCVVMLVALAGLVNYGVTGSFLPEWLSSNSTDPTDATENTTVTILTKDGQTEVEADALAGYMDDVVVTMGDHTMTNADLQLYYWMVAYNEEDVDLTVSLAEQIYDEETGKTWHDYCLEQAVDSWRELTLMAMAGEEAGYELPSDYQEYLDSMEAELESYVYMYQYYYGYNISTVDELIQMMYGPGSNYETYYDYVYVTYYGGLYWSEMLEDFEVTDDQIEDYFAENEESLKTDYTLPITKDFGNMMDIRNIMITLITTEDEDGNTVEDWDATLAKAQKVYDLWVAGGMTEEAFIALVAEHSEDEGSNSYEGLYTDMYKNSMSEVDVRHILIMPEDDEDEESWASALASAEEILNQWLTNPTEEYFAELANEHSDDNSGAVTNGGIYTDVYIGQMVEAFEEWCFDSNRQAGDYGIVKTEYGYHIMYFVRADNEVDNWVCDESRVAGDVAILACDDGYQIIYFVGSEPAWYRYCRYGAQALIAEDVLEQLMNETAYTVDTDAVVIASN